MPVLSIPNLCVNGWTPHSSASTGVGVPGGIEQYRPGGANARAVVLNAVDDLGADPTGLVSCHTILKDGLDSLADNQTLLVEYGVFLLSSPIYIAQKSKVTLRGSGPGVRSTSTITMGLGTHTFNVPSGLGWTGGIGCRVNKRNDQRVWMRGTVVSYSGTSLVLDITSKSSDTSTLSDWFVSQTHFIVADNFATFGLDDQFIDGNGITAIINEPAAGDDVIELTSASSYNVGDLINIQHIAGEEVYSVGGDRNVRPIINRVAAKSGNELTLAVPLQIALPVSLSPGAARSNYHSEGVGIEDLSATGINDNSTTIGKVITFQMTYGSWLYNVHVAEAQSFLMDLNRLVRCEVAYCSASFRVPNPSGPGGAALILGATNACLIRHSFFHDCEPSTEFNSGNIGCAFLFNYAPNNYYDGNHNPHNAFNLHEGNITFFMQWDGYYGSASHETVFRNYSINGHIAYRRFHRYCNSVGNIAGTSGVHNGSISHGYPFMGGGATSGETCNSILGDFARHVDGDGLSRLNGTITNRVSDSECYITLSSGTKADLQGPHILNGATSPIHTQWAPFSYYSNENRRTGMTVDLAGSTDTVIHMTGGSGEALPPLSTAINIYTGEYGCAEQDDAVEETAFIKGNFIASSAGGGAIDFSLGSDTLPDSLAYGDVPPFDWPVGVLDYPPVRPDDPGFDHASIPAGYYYANGEWPVAAGSIVATPEFTPPGGEYEGTQVVEITCDTADAEIRYTTDGSTPTASTGTIYTTGIGVPADITLKARAFKVGLIDSQVATASYVITAPPGGGTATTGRITVSGRIKLR